MRRQGRPCFDPFSERVRVRLTASPATPVEPVPLPQAWKGLVLLLLYPPIRHRGVVQIVLLRPQQIRYLSLGCPTSLERVHPPLVQPAFQIRCALYLYREVVLQINPPRLQFLEQFRFDLFQLFPELLFPRPVNLSVAPAHWRNPATTLVFEPANALTG